MTETPHTWDPDRYLAYDDERGRPFVDLVARVGATAPAAVVDLGCGPGNLTRLLAERWPDADVVGVDWRVPLERAVPRVGGRAVQGNLDPALVLAPTEVMLDRAAQVLAAGRGAPGHVFNLGHGVLPSTDPDKLARLADFVHETSAAAAQHH